MFFYTDFTFKALVIASLLLKLRICIDERANGNHMRIHVMNTKTTLAVFTLLQYTNRTS